MLTTFQAIVLGLVEGITEYLPVSSTGHLILASGLMGLNRDPAVKQAVDDFNIIIQGGAILAVVGLYFPRFLQMLRGLMGKDAAGLRLFINIAVAFTPAAIVGLLFDDMIEAALFKPGPVIGALIVGGLFMIALDVLVISKRRGARNAHAAGLDDVARMSLGQALTVGLMQVAALWPGTSRSMMTIAGGVVGGLTPRAAAEFSFLLGMPTLLAATGYKLAKNLRHAAKTGEPTLFETLGWTPVLIGMLVAAVSAAFAVKWLVGFLNKHGLTPFGIYRILVGLLLMGLINRGMVTIEPPAAAPVAAPTTP
ncbi:MAG: undecaprenyl-diphosphate phosphatase [Phycisphaerales bacterium]